MNRQLPGQPSPEVRPRAQSGWALVETIAVLAVVSILLGFGMHAWQERKQRAVLAGELAGVRALAYRLDRKYCARTATMQMTLPAARTDLGENLAVRDSARWRIHLELPATGPPGAAVDEYFLHRSPALVVYRTPRASWQGTRLLQQAGAAARFVTAGGETFDTVQVPVGQPAQPGGSRQEFRFLTRAGSSLDSRC